MCREERQIGSGILHYILKLTVYRTYYQIYTFSKTGNASLNVTLRRVRVTTVNVEVL